jgi:transposase
MVIEHDCRLVLEKNEYFMMIPRKKVVSEPKTMHSYCGIDMGIRTFATVFGSEGCTEVDYHAASLDKLNKRIDGMRRNRFHPLEVKQRLRTRRRKLNKCERRKTNMVDELHWKTIRCILNKHNFVFYGDIKSHDIVKDGENRWLNRRFQDLRLCEFKQRLEEKCIERNRYFVAVDEHYTTKTCSCCGTMNEPGKSKVYHCSSCKRTMGRDVNAAKNILMKGIVRFL